MSNIGTTLATGQALNVNDFLLSGNGSYKAIMQSDGNFVIYAGSKPIWASNTVRGNGTYYAVMQSDGNFVLYNGTPQHQGPPYWASNTVTGGGEYSLCMQNDGNLVIYRGSATWASNTVQSGSQPQQTVTVPAFPITASRQDQFPNTGGSMNTQINITKNSDGSGHLNAVTHTWEVTMLRGYRGSVAVAVLDGNQNALWVSGTQSYGVDGTAIGTHDRTDNWTDTIPAQILPNVRYVAIIQKDNSNNLFSDIGNWLKGIASIASELGPIIQAVTTIAALAAA